MSDIEETASEKSLTDLSDNEIEIEQVQSTPDNSNLQGKSKKVRVIGSSKKNNKINNNNK